MYGALGETMQGSNIWYVRSQTVVFYGYGMKLNTIEGYKCLSKQERKGKRKKN